jgi:hypothetical protein
VDAFSYLSVLLSIILGLGITQVLTSAGRLIRAREAVVVYWPPLLWAGLLLVIYVQSWWSMFGLRLRAEWSFLAFLVVLLQTVVLYMLAALVLPEEVGASGVDLRAYYERQAPWFFGFLAGVLVISALKEVILEGHLPVGANLGFHLFLGALAGLGIFLRRAWYHQAMAVVSAGAFALYITILFSQLR